MKTTIALIISTLFTASAFAISAPSQYPTESGWAIAMTEAACGVQYPEGSKGSILKDGDGVFYMVVAPDSVILGAAKATSTFIWAKKSCSSLSEFFGE